MKRAILIASTAIAATVFATAVSTTFRPEPRNRCACCEKLARSGRVILRGGNQSHIREWRTTCRRHAEVCPFAKKGGR